MDKPRTLTVPLEKRAALLEGTDPVTALREHGAGIEHALRVEQERFFLGSAPSSDVVVSSPYVSSLHCVLERRGMRLRVHDQTTRNGTMFRGVKDTGFDIGPGDTFVAATTTLLALSEDMRVARAVFGDVLGHDDHARVDDALIAGIRGALLLVTGEPGCGQAELARAIHRASLRREHALVELDEEHAMERLEQAQRGTLVVPVRGDRLDRDVIAAMLAPERNLRLVVLAPTLDVAVKSLGLDTCARLEKLAIRPLRERSGDIPALLDGFLAEQGATLRTADLTAPNQAALRAHAWPENLDELREAAARIAALVAHGSIRKAAPAIGVARSTFQYWAERLGLELPLA